MADAHQNIDDLEQLKRALSALKKARARIDALEQARTEPIAIIGIGCRLPGGCNTPQAFWEMLREGRSAMVPPSADRWDAKAFEATYPDEPGKMQSSLSGFLDQVDQFDPHFFGIAPREAHAMDPQQRLALESAWEALEDAGIVPSDLSGSSTGVFIGIGLNDYSRLQIPAQAEDPTLMDNYFIQGNSLCITANRISYALNLQGPSMAIDTACSSSMSAMHTACQSLRNGDSSLALVGGTNVILAPDNSVGLGKFLAPDGLCKTFDSRANGYTRGEGAIVFVLKRLSEAQADGDRIYAVILGTSINQDGFSSGLTVPNGSAQEAMLRTALKNSNLQPGDIDYIEAHGTGTSLGDPIEANALGAVFAGGREAGQELLVGSVKTNIGHLEAGAGIAGMLKVALALYHGEIPPSLNFLKPNPLIDFERLRLQVVTKLRPWPKCERPNRAGISSFGFGGTNSHAIVEAAPAPSRAEPAPFREQRLFTLSAKTPEALAQYARRFAEFLPTAPGLGLAQVCDTVNRRRSVFQYRLAAVAENTTELAQTLTDFAAGLPAPALVNGNPQQDQPRLAFLFTGQGSQYTGMGRALYQSEPAFRAALDRCEAVYRQGSGESLLDIIFDKDGSQAGRIDHTAVTQPALFAVEYALSELWQSWGIRPDIVTGHSIGEYVAACVAGVFSVEDGMKLVMARGRLMGALPEGGTMLTLFAPVEQVLEAIGSRRLVSVAAVNAPDSIVISGDTREVEEVRDIFKERGVQSRPLVVSHAFHSPLMDPILDEFERAAAACRFSKPSIPLISNLTGKPFAEGQIPDAAYWRKHIRGAVQFAAGMQTLHQLGYGLFLEVGPSPVLINLGKRCLPEDTGIWAPSLRQGQPESAQMLKALGMLFVHGVPVDWNLIDGPDPYPVASMPTYPFQRERYWFKTPARKARRDKVERPLLGKRLRSPSLQGDAFETEVHPDELGYLWDHRAYGSALFPAAGFIDMALSAGALLQPGAAVMLEDVTIQDTLILPEGQGRSLHITAAAEQNGSRALQIFSAREESPDERWQLHAYGSISATQAPADGGSLEEARAACGNVMDAAEFYAALRRTGMEYGPAFQNIREMWLGEKQALARVALGADLPTSGYTIHPALLDACLQAAGASILSEDETYLPIAFEQIRLYRPAGRELWSYARISPGATPESFSADLTFYTPEGDIAAQVNGMRLKRTTPATMQRLIQQAAGHTAFADWLYRQEWTPAPLPAGHPTAVLPERWLVLADDGDAQDVARGIPRAVVATAGDTFAQVDAARWSVRLSERQDFDAVLGAVQPGGVICLSESIEAILHLTQAATAMPAAPQIWLAARGSQPVLGAGGSDDVNVRPAALWGFARSARLEYPDGSLRCVDLDPAALPSQNARSLWEEITAQIEDDEIAYRNDVRYVHQLARIPAAPAEEKPVRLEITARGELDNLALRPMQRRPLQPGEVEIAVRATGLNFRDVLNTLGMYPGDAGGLGHECSGVVSAVGEGVTGMSVGEPVLALAADCFATYAVARAEFVMPKPAQISFEQAATIPITFLTAAYALETLGHMQPGERVLIHAGAGGVGLAAIQLAKLAGAEIYATAGSPEKRAMLSALGVQHVMDSRTLEFADTILKQTGGEGVHLVLNSLADEFIPKSLGVLVHGGRFLEIGKRGIWTHEQVDALGKDIAYHIIYLGEVCEQDPQLVNTIFRELMRRFETGALQPLPWRAYPLEQAQAAFRFMAMARHTGKIVLTQPGHTRPAPALRPEASYLITGGMGGLGLTIAGQMAAQGAGNLLLAGLREPGPEIWETIRTIQEASGARVSVLVADIARREEVERLMDLIQREYPPLAGIVHTAGVLDDGVMVQQTAQRYQDVFAPKLDAAWYLHECSSHLPLDFFVLFSAGAGWLGSAGQTGYAAANTAVDALVSYRRARGLPAASIAWGPWAEVGMAARLNKADQERMTRQGIALIPAADGAQVFLNLLGASGPVAVLPIDWQRFGARDKVAPRFRALTHQTQAEGAAETARARSEDIRKRLAEAPASKRRSLLQAHLREHAMRVLGLSASYNLDSRQPLRELGMDSLMAVELRNAISASMQQKLPATLLFDFPTIEALTGFLAPQLWQETKTTPEPAPAAPAPAADGVENLSDEEAEALLLAELEKSKRK